MVKELINQPACVSEFQHTRSKSQGPRPSLSVASLDMATFVIDTTKSGGALQSVQIGPADVVATVSAAYGAWGWLGGLKGLGSILRLTQDKTSADRIGKIFNAIEAEMKTCHILGQEGLQVLAMQDTEAFGGTVAEKLVALTLCALAHVMELKSAVRLFLEHIADTLLMPRTGNILWPGAKDALRSFLFDRTQLILNEGEARALPARFDHEIAIAGLKSVSGRVAHSITIKEPLLAQEAPYIVGFIKWLLDRVTEPYFTRSATVARLGVNFRSVGYNIASVTIWDGHGPRPVIHRGLVLVTGGSHETDPLLRDPYDNISIHIIAHYRYQTVGSMLWNSFNQVCENTVETLQQDFEEINEEILRDLSMSWAYLDMQGEQIQAYFGWPSRPRATRHATRLATFLFPDVVEEISVYYERIATEACLEEVKRESRKSSAARYLSRTVQRFLSVSASICLAILGKFGGKTFWDMQHATMFSLESWDQLRWLSREASTILSGGMPMSRILGVVSTIHCANQIPRPLVSGGHQTEAEGGLEQGGENSVVVGWRRGRYAVLPGLLFGMSAPLEESILHLRCADTFISNIVTRRNGSVHSTIGLPGAIRFGSINIPSTANSPSANPGTTPPDSEKALSTTTECYRPIVLGPASKQPPDKPLYINIERSPMDMVSGEAELSICGRMDGEPLGHVGIHDVLCTISLSRSDEEGYAYRFCNDDYQSNHESIGNICQGLGKAYYSVSLVGPSPATVSARTVYNMSPSTFCHTPGITPRCRRDDDSRNHVYVQVSQDTPWAIFLAGMDKIHSRICFACTECSPHTGANCTSNVSGGLRTLIGYHD